jgi:threonine dehydratase
MAVTLAEIEAALPVVRRFFPPTPLFLARRLSARLGAEVWLKLDNVTPTRTFKLRGAVTKVNQLAGGGSRGVITASAGNHGWSVAWAARSFGLRCVVYVPRTANPFKADAIAAEGAEVVRHGEDYQEALEESLRRGEVEGLDYVHAYDDPWIVRGQGTLGLELERADKVLLGVGGGGLIAGVAVAVTSRWPGTAVFGAQPEGADSMVRSLEAGRVVGIERVSTCADGLGARRPSELTFNLVQRHVAGVDRVSDAALIAAARLLLHEERVVAEPAGAAGMALLEQRPDLRSGRVVVVVSGANLSPEILGRLL